MLVRGMLEQALDGRVDLRWARTYDEGREALRQSDYDVGLIDYRLGAKNGLELLKETRQRQLTTPLILLTGQADADLATRALRNGATDYLDKSLLIEHDIGPALLERSISFAIERAERRFQDLFEVGPDAIVVLGDDGVVRMVNARAERLFGCPRSDLIGQGVEQLVAPELRQDFREHCVTQVRSGEAKTIGVSEDVQIVARDGRRIPVEINLSPYHHESGQLVVATLRDTTQRRALQRQLAEAADNERRHIGQELHDGIGQQLTGLAFMCQRLQQKCAGTDESEYAGNLAELAKTTLSQVRELARGMCPVQVLDDSLIAALNNLADETRTRFGIRCVVRHDPEVEVNDTNLATNLFLIAREAVNNAIKHSKADRITITLDRPDGHVRMQVRDSGVGMAKYPIHAEGMGLRLIRHRASLIGASLNFTSKPGAGMTVTCTMNEEGVGK